MKRHEAYPSKYLKAADVAQPTTATVRSVAHEAMTDGKLKPVVFVDGFQKGIVVNVTNADVLYGLAESDDDADWHGVTIELYTEMAKMPGREPAPSIRFRVPQKKTTARPGKAPPPSQAALDDEIPF